MHGDKGDEKEDSKNDNMNDNKSNKRKAPCASDYSTVMYHFLLLSCRSQLLEKPAHCLERGINVTTVFLNPKKIEYFSWVIVM